jgi:hypothetical protein
VLCCLHRLAFAERTRVCANVASYSTSILALQEVENARLELIASESLNEESARAVGKAQRRGSFSGQSP